MIGHQYRKSPVLLTEERIGNIPDELRRLRQWVCWRWKQVKDRLTKVPVRADGTYASTTDPGTWCAFDEAVRESARFDGVGFMFANGYCGIDFDNYRDPQTGLLHPVAGDLVKRFDSYAEVSPSGKGIHIIVKAKLPGGGKRRSLEPDREIEIYDKGRYFTVTGDRIHGDKVREAPADVRRLYIQLGGKWPEAVEAAGQISGGQPVSAPERQTETSTDLKALLDRACAADSTLAKLAAGGNCGYASASEADLAFFNKIKRIAGRDPRRMRDLALLSGRNREKFHNHKTYLSDTITRSLNERSGPTEDLVGSAKNNADGTQAGASDRGLRFFPYTDTGNAERLASRFGADVRYCHSEKTWLYYGGKRWVPDERGRLMQLAKEVVRELYEEAPLLQDPKERSDCENFARRSESTERKKSMLVSLQSEPGIPIERSNFDRDEFLLNCENGTINLQTGDLRPHSRKDLITRLAPAVYSPGARQEEWERFLDHLTGGDQEYRKFLQCAVGYSLTACTREEVLFVAYGPTRTGKSTFFEALKSVMGDYAKTADFDTFAEKANPGIPNDIAALVGRRLVVASEVENGKQWAEKLLKSITGRDTMIARFLYGEFFEFKPVLKLWVACNHEPKLSSRDDAIWRRVLQLPFSNQVGEGAVDRTLKERLCCTPEARSAILTWAVEGAVRYYEEGLNPPRSIMEASRAYRAGQDPANRFIEDCCIIGPGAWTPSDQLYAAYQEYCERRGFTQALTKKAFAERLKWKGCEPLRKHEARGWSGISLQGEAAQVA